MHIYTKVYVWGWMHSDFSSSFSLLSALHSDIGPSEHFTASHASSMFWCHYSCLVAAQAFREARRIGYLRPDRPSTLLTGRTLSWEEDVQLCLLVMLNWHPEGPVFYFCFSHCLAMSLRTPEATGVCILGGRRFEYILSSWSLTSRSCEPVWPSGKALGW